MSEPCTCPVAGWCARHQIKKHQRYWQLCQGINCTPEQSLKRRKKWDAEIGVQPPKTETRARNSEPRERVSKPFDPVSREKWPAPAKLIAALSVAEDVGVGDTIKRLLGVAGTTFQAAVRLLTGSDCRSCGFRQSKWNQLYPYERGE